MFRGKHLVNSTNINAIQARYKASLGEKKMLIDNYRSRLFDTTSSLSELYEEVHADLHKLAGSLGMYGYDDLALQARLAMESALTGNKQELDESLVKLSLLFAEYS